MEQGTTPATYLPDELVVEILARLPAKSLCRFKCVSHRWRRLISDPAHRARFVQTLSGFFFLSDEGPRFRFTALPSSVTPLEEDGDGPPLVDAALSFLPPRCGKIEMLDSCNGLLLLRCYNELSSSPPPPFYVVCNPATREWVALPQPRYNGYGQGARTWYAAVGFDPAISSHFYVFQVVEVHDAMPLLPIAAVEVYSSETGTWVLRECKPEWIYFYGRMTYFNGSLHLPIEHEEVVSVDPNGQSWKVTQVRHCEDHGHREGRGYVGHCRGRLIYANNDRKYDVLSIYVREDQASREWIMKHNVSKSDLLFEPWKHMLKPTYYIAGFHPDGDLVFFYDRTRNMLISYDMNHGDWHVVCTLEDFRHAHHPFFPYVPWYSRGLASPNIN